MKRRFLILAGSLVSLGVAAGAQQSVQAPRFEVDVLWPQPLPNRWILGSAVGVAVDARDHVYVVHLTDSFNARTEIGAASNPPTSECCAPAPNVLEFDPAGKLVGHWGGAGKGHPWPTANHGIAIDPQNNIWIAGVGGMDTQLLKFARDGKFLMEVGKTVAAPAPGAARPGDTTYAGVSGAPRPPAANRPVGRGGGPQLPPASSSTDAFGGASAMSFDAATNEAFVADGWRNRRVAVVDMATGAIKRFWGASGNKPDDAVRTTQQFGTPVSCAELARDGLLYVCDRANNRLQVFRKDGSFVKEKVIAPNTKGEGSVWDVAFSRDPQQRYLYVADGLNMKVHILDRQSLNVLTSFGNGGRQPGQFYALHSIATDSRGNIYTTETYEGKRVQKFNFKGVGAVTTPARTTWPRSGGSQ